MQSKPSKTPRIHALDSLRAIMMLLGLVLHTAITYNVTEQEAWNLRDPHSTHLFSDFLVLLIHSFRMPIFFVVAGFFGALLFYERRTWPMIRNRLQRILLPFIVFLFVLRPIIMFSFSYTRTVFAKDSAPFLTAARVFQLLDTWIPVTTAHLWFLYYLCLITASGVILAMVLQYLPVARRLIRTLFDWFMQRPLARALAFTGSVYLVLLTLNTAMVDASVSLKPDSHTYIYFCYFYLMGWLLYKSKQYLNTLLRYDWAFTITAVALTIAQGLFILDTGLSPNGNNQVLIWLSAAIVSLFTLGITGLFIRYTSIYSPLMRYLSDASYWVYLIHLPLTAFLPGVVFILPFSAFGKFILVLLTTTAICFVSYHFLVRNTFIGQFLNGRRYPIRAVDHQ